MPSAARSFGKDFEIIIGALSWPNQRKDGELYPGRKPSGENIGLDSYFLALAASSAAALLTAEAFTGAPCALASVSAAAQLASLARPGSTKGRIAANGERNAK